MANKVPVTPPLPLPPASGELPGVYRHLGNLNVVLGLLFTKYGSRLNGTYQRDGTEVAEAPVRLASYTVAGVPAAASYEGAIIYVSNETGGKTVAFSDGVNWRRVQDRAVIA